uniref:Uncharacterized protein n=1 Tax=Sipha flava TaxID=143950 RepID=A0A2S2Q589_9HEMI
MISKQFLILSIVIVSLVHCISCRPDNTNGVKFVQTASKTSRSPVSTNHNGTMKSSSNKSVSANNNNSSTIKPEAGFASREVKPKRISRLSSLSKAAIKPVSSIASGGFRILQGLLSRFRSIFTNANKNASSNKLTST